MRSVKRAIRGWHDLVVPCGIALGWLAIQWGTDPFALDAHHSVAWCLFWAFAVGLFARGHVRLVDWKMPTVGAAAIVGLVWGGDHGVPEDALVHVTLWWLLWAQPTDAVRFRDSVGRASSFLVIGCGTLLLLFAAYRMVRGEWGHQASYDLWLPWAHRNIGFESLALLSLAAAGQSARKSAGFLLGLLALAWLYQVRSVMLFAMVWAVLLAVPHVRQSKRFRVLVGTGLGLFLMAQVGWNLLPVHERVSAFERVPDVFKTLDVAYNLQRAESSSDRVALWVWTWDHLPAIGQGSGSWRHEAEGNVNAVLDKCGVAVRRAHSELLQWVFEFGWLGILALGALAWPRIKAHWRLGVMLSPFLLFTFPFERAEIVASLALVGLVHASSNRSEAKPNWGSTTVFLGILVVGLAWQRSQSKLGWAVRGQGRMAEFSALDRLCIDAFPEDAAMNHVDVLIATEWAATGDSAKAIGLVERHLKAHPNNLGALRLWGKLSGVAAQDLSECEVLEKNRRTFFDQSTKP
jgi:hypothetical protein